MNGYQRKTKPAPWTTTPSEVRRKAKETDQRRVGKAMRLAEKRREWRRPIRRSKVARKATAAYPEKAAAFVAAAVALEYTCPVVATVSELLNGVKYGWPVSFKLNEIHHWAGRGHGGRGPLLMDERLWLPLSKQGHRYVHSHRQWAIENGFLAPMGQFNTPVPPDATVIRLPNGGIKVISANKYVAAGVAISDNGGVNR